MLQPVETTPQGIDPGQLLHLQQLAEAPNLADAVEDPEGLGRKVIDYFEIDQASMAEWSEKMDKALDLACLIKKDKSHPWSGASNCLLYTSPSPRDRTRSRMPSSA